ncbi:unnamed protein product [Alopecurus aequalis]
MSGADQVVLFGSFTEDETKLFQGQPVADTKSKEKALELPEIQFGSLNFSMLSLEKASNHISKGPVHPTKSTCAPAKDHACNNKKETVASSLPNGGPVLFNGCASNGVLKNVKSEATVPSAGPVSNVKETEAVVLSAGPVNNVKKTEAPVSSAGPVNNVKKTKATVLSPGPVNIVKKTEAMVPSAGHVNNVKKTEATVPSPGPVNNVKKTEATVPSPGPVNNVKKVESAVLSGVPVLNISSSTPLAMPGRHHAGIKGTQSSSSDMQVTENGSTGVDASTIAAPVDESVTSLNEEVYQNKPLLPHGLKNTGNICFLNATLQAFLSCTPFVQLVQDLRNRNIPKVGYPTLSAFIELISQFDVLDESSMKKDEKFAIISAKVINPAMFDQVLRNFTPDVPAGTSARPRQEDAQEFLSFAMDRMHDELLKLNGDGSNSKEGMVVSASDDDAWETVGRKNKSAIVRTQSFVPSELSAIFGGQLQSMVKAAGNRGSAFVQPFLLLHLDIFPDAVQTVEDALHLFSTPESLEGYRTAAGKAGVVTARKSFKIHALSKIMILHLKRFSYGNHGCTKLYKPLYFPLELVLHRDLLSSPSSEGRKYELVATITHHGSGPSRGHYTADAKHTGGQWLRFDDNVVMPINVHKVLHDQAYVLFYKQV